MHLMMDVLISHELELTIAASEVSARLDEWNRVLTARTRAEYVKGIARFVGLDLLEYEHAQVHKHKSGDFTAKIHSRQWLMRQPT